MAKNLKFLDYYFSYRSGFQFLLSELQRLEYEASSPIESSTALESFDSHVAAVLDIIDQMVFDSECHKIK